MIIICDIDGTIANLEHRLHNIQHEKNKDKRWGIFHKECVNDTPIYRIITIVKDLEGSGHDIIFMSGRNSEVRGSTIAWLDFYVNVGYELYMRDEKDYRTDYIIKSELLDKAQEDLCFKDKDILCVLDDRASVVEMWRARGLTCLQVAKGDF